MSITEMEPGLRVTGSPGQQFEAVGSRITGHCRVTVTRVFDPVSTVVKL